MKKIVLLNLAIVTLLLTACQDEDNGTNRDVIYASWRPVYSGTVCTSGSETIIDLEGCEAEETIEFSTFGNYVIKSYDLVNDNCEPSDLTSGTFDKDEAQLTLYDEDGDITAILTILENTSNVLKIAQYNNDVNYTCEDSDDPILYNYTYCERITYGP